MLEAKDLKKNRLPDSPGVYLFKNRKDILYIGKATSLKDRVKSYFSKDLLVTRGPLIADLIFKADKISFLKTDSVLEAVILEANLIKKYQPRYNTKEKDNKSFNYLTITQEDFPRLLIVRGKNLSRTSYKYVFGPYTNSVQLTEAIKIIRKIFPFRDKCQPKVGKPCFNCQIGLCPGVCIGKINKNEYQKIIKKIVLLFSGKISILKKRLTHEMSQLAQRQEYEKAKEIRDQIYALNHIQDVALIRDEQEIASLNNFKTKIKENSKKFRIEAYDVAHFSGTNNVGVMVVFNEGELDKKNYRKFRIRNSRGSDVDALKEILSRRMTHEEWPLPDLVVLDGGIAQLNSAIRIFNSILETKDRKIAVVAVTKDKKHKAKAIICQSSSDAEVVIKKYKSEILLINNEAHRFAIEYHRSKRKIV